MSIRLTKPWVPLGELAPDSLPAQLGVFQLADARGRVVFVGYGGGRAPFGLRTEIEAAVAAAEAEGWGPPISVRWELNHGYLSRYHELLMVHLHDHGAAPEGNQESDLPGGRLSPGDAPPNADEPNEKRGN